MKVNEAPEKIYLEKVYPDNGVLPNGLNYIQSPNDIEYTRTDAFINKAEKFFIEKFEVEDYNDNIDIDGSPIFNYGRFIDDFVNYMKGE